MILLEEQEITLEIDKWLDGKVEARHVSHALVQATGKKILIQLQAIYNIPDLGTSDRRMGEFIQELQEEVE